MKATIWHNPMCGTSRKTLDILNESGADVTVIEYLGEPYSREKLEQLLRLPELLPQQLEGLVPTVGNIKDTIDGGEGAFIEKSLDTILGRQLYIRGCELAHSTPRD